jgi:hypothetical protein
LACVPSENHGRGVSWSRPDWRPPACPRSILAHSTLFLLLLLFGMHVPRAAAQTATQGRWSTVLDPNNPTQPLLAPINPVHAALMPNGKVLIIAGSGSCSPGEPGCPTGAPYGPSNGSGAALYDPLARAFTAFSLSWDMFCNGMVLLPSGNALIAGGTSRYDPDFTGQPKTAIFDPWAAVGAGPLPGPSGTGDQSRITAAAASQEAAVQGTWSGTFRSKHSHIAPFIAHAGS